VAFKKKEDASPSERATRSLLGIIARLGACAYLIYIVVKLVKNAAEGVEGVPMPLAIISAVVLGVAALFFAVITVMQFFRGVQNQDYSMHKYYAEDLAKQGLRMNEYGEYVPLEVADDEDDDELVESAEDEDAPGTAAEEPENFEVAEDDGEEVSASEENE